MNLFFYQQIKLQWAAAADLIEQATVFLYAVAENEKSLMAKLPREYWVFILKLRILYKSHPTTDGFHRAILPLLHSGNIYKLSIFFNRLLNDHRPLLTSNDASADAAVCLLNQCISFKNSLAAIPYHYSPEIDGLLACMAALSQQDLNSNELKDFDLSKIQQFKKYTQQKRKDLAVFINNFEYLLADYAAQSIHEVLLTLPLIIDYNQPVSRQLPADSAIGQTIAQFPDQKYNLSKILKKFETLYIQARDSAQAIDGLLAESGGRRLNYLNQSLEKVLHFNHGLCLGGVYSWAREFPLGAQLGPKPDQTKAQLKTYSDLNNSRLTAELFKLQQNQFNLEQRNTNSTHYATRFSTIKFSSPEPEAAAKLLVQGITQALSTAGFNYVQRSQELPTIEVTLLSQEGKLGHALGLKVFKFNNQFFYRFFDYEYGEFEFSSLKSFNIFLVGFLKITPYLSKGKMDHCELRFLLPRHPNQKTMLHEFQLKIAKSQHPLLKSLHREASLSPRNTELRAKLRAALTIALKNFVRFQAGQYIQTELEKGLASFQNIHEKTIEDKMSASLLYRPLLAYYLDLAPNKWLSGVKDHIKLISDIAEDDDADWHWRLILISAGLRYAKDAYPYPPAKDFALNLLKTVLQGLLNIRTSQPGPLQSKVLDYQEQASQIMAELSSTTEFPHQLTKTLAEMLDHEFDKNFNELFYFWHWRKDWDSFKTLEGESTIPGSLLLNLIVFLTETVADLAVSEPTTFLTQGGSNKLSVPAEPSGTIRLRAKL